MAKQGPPNRIIATQLEAIALEARDRGLTEEGILRALNDELLWRDPNARKIGVTSLRNYWKTLDEGVVPLIHKPQIANQNAMLAINLGGQIEDLNNTLKRWLEEADAAQRQAITDQGEVIDLGPDWQARTSVARELRQHSMFIADVLEKIHNATQVAAFQRIVMETIQKADPDTARRIVEEMQKLRSIRDAALLGVAA